MKRRDFAIGATALTASALGMGAGAAARAADLAVAPFRGRQDQVERAWRQAMSGARPVLGRSDALLILQGGKITFERYGADHGPGVRHVSWSMAKSFTHALVGIGVADGRVDIDRPLSLVSHPDPGLTLRRLLNLTDGHDWREASYEPEKSAAARMLYGPGRLDGASYTAAMHQAAQALLGKHDFSAFRAAACQAASPLRTLDRLDVVRREEEVVIEAGARSFLHHQVRNLVGTLVEVGQGKRAPDWPRAVLDGRDRTRAGQTAPAEGLCFMAVP